MAEERTDTARTDPAAVAASERARALLGTVLAGRYRIDGIIAMGGMGAVLRGEHVHMRKRVAVKVLHPETQNLPELVTRFERESIVGAHATHPNVTSATDFGRLEDGSYYLVLEYVDGITLHDLMNRGPIPVGRAVEIARQISLGLEAIHKLDIFHRDLKPRNIMIVEGTPDVVKILDFGFAKVPLERFSPTMSEAIAVTSKGTVFGTVGYMAPETAYGMHAVTHRSDLYAVGVLLYEMLTGLHPFDDKDSKALFGRHQLERPPPFQLRAPNRAVPPELEALTMRLLEKAPRDRFQSARELVVALEEVRAAIDGDAGAPSVRPPSVAPRREDQFDESPRPSVAEPPLRRRGSVLPWLLTLLLLAAGAVMLRFPDWRERARQLLGGAAPSAAPAPASSSSPLLASSAAPPASGATAAASSTSPAAAPATVTVVDGLDAVKWRGVIKDAATAQDASRGTRALLALVELDPAAFGEPDVVAAAAAAAIGIQRGDKGMADKVFEALGGERVGSGGADVLFQMTSFFGGSRGAQRAAELLRRSDIVARRSPALKIAMALRDAPCKERPALFEQAASEGDERAMHLLSDMRSPSCAPSSGACCMPANAALEATLVKLRLRLAK